MIAKALTSLALAIALLLPLSAVAQAFTVFTERPTYLPGDTVVVYGTAPAGSWVGVSILNPDGKEVDFKMVMAGPDNTYRTEFKLPSVLPYGDWKMGTYTVRAYLGALTRETQFVISLGARVTGRVVDIKGNPVSEAEVLVVETGDRTVTKADGTFEFFVSPGAFTIRVSKVGYRAVELTVTLKVGDNDLGKIVLTSYEELVQALEARISELESRLTKLEQTTQQLVETVVSGLEDVKKTLATVSAKVDTVSGKVDDVSRSLAALSGKVDAVSAKVDTVSGKVDAVKADIIAKVDDVSRSLSAAVEATRRDLTAKIDAAVSDLSRSVTAVSGKVDAVSAKVDTVSGKVDAISGTLATVSKTLSDVVNSLGGISTSIKSVSDVINKLSPTVEALRADVTALRTDLTALRTSVDAVKTGVDSLRADQTRSFDALRSDLSGKIDGATTLGYVAVVFALLAFVMATLSFITIRKVTAVPK